MLIIHYCVYIIYCCWPSLLLIATHNY